MYLVDTNIFLEILLGQSRKEDCKQFLENHIGQLHLSDFSLHSIGVILFRYGKEQIFTAFVADVLPQVNLVTLSRNNYSVLSESKRNFGLDFDDAYQFSVAQEHGLIVVTQDKDFSRVNKQITVQFL